MENSDLDLIEAYLGDKLSPNDKASFQARLNTEPALAAELQAETVLREALKQRQDERMMARFKQHQAQLFQEPKPLEHNRPFIRQYGRLSAAAGLILLIVATYFVAVPLLRQNAEPQAFKENYSRLKYSGDLSASTQQAEEQTLNRAFTAYQSNHYPDAIREAETLLHSDRYADWARLLLGACYLEQNKPEEAIANFSTVRRDALSLYNLAQWNIAMTHIRSKSTAEARKQLQSIASDPENNFAVKARKLLDTQ